MNKTKDQRLNLRAMIRPLLWGTIVGILVTVLLLLATALVMAVVQLPAAAVVPTALATVSLGALAGGFTAARISRERGLLYGAVSGLLLFLIIAVAGMLAMPSTSGATTFVKLALTVGLGAFGGILGVNVGRR